MKNKTQLSVRPVRKSRKPGYPSWQEPNPLEQPYAQPYPFTQKAINWLAASGLCGALFLMPEAEGKPSWQGTSVPQIERDTLKNPFVWEKMGLPFYTSAYGTGAPERISEQEARAVIDSVFRRENLILEKGTVQTEHGIVEVSGMDKDRKIGYVWLSYNNLDLDISLHSDFELKDFNGEKLITYKPVLENRLNSFRSIKDLYWYYHNWSLNTNSVTQKAFMARLKSMMDNGEPDWKDDYRWMFYENQIKTRLEYADKSPLNSRIKHYLSRTLSMKDGSRRHERMETASFLSSIPYYMNDKDLLNAIVKAAKTKSPKLNISRVITIWFALNSFKAEPSYQQKADIMRSALKKGENNWQEAAAISMQWRDSKKVSHPEILDLQQNGETDNFFIAPISFHDEILEYQTTEANLARVEESFRVQMLKVYVHCDSLAKDTTLQKHEPSYWERCQKMDFSDREELEAAVKYIREVNGISKEQALKNLEKQVLDYILWAKQQRGY